MVLSAGVHSPALSSDPVKVYNDHDFTGTSASFTSVGDYVINTASTGIADNTISSIKVAPGWSAELYTNSDFTGYSWSYTYNQDNITNNLDNLVSAIRITRTSTPSPARAPAPSPARAPARAPAPSPATSTNKWWIIGIVITIMILLCMCLVVGFVIYSKSKR